MENIWQMLVTILFLLPAGFLIYYTAAGALQLARGFRSGEARSQRNALYLIALCFLGLFWLRWFWFWLMWKMDGV